MDNISGPRDLVVTGVHRSLRWQPDSHPDSGRPDHLDIQPGLWPAGLGLKGAITQGADERKFSRMVSRESARFNG